MKEQIRRKLEQMADRRDEVGRLLADPAVLARPDAYRDLSVEFSRLDPVVAAFGEWRELERQLGRARREMVFVSPRTEAPLAFAMAMGRPLTMSSYTMRPPTVFPWPTRLPSRS